MILSRDDLNQELLIYYSVYTRVLISEGRCDGRRGAEMIAGVMRIVMVEAMEAGSQSQRTGSGGRHCLWWVTLPSS